MVEPHVANVDVASSNLVSRSILFKHIVIYVETVAELLVLAMAMFLAAFFCLRVAFIPQNAYRDIEKIYEVEEAIYQER